MHPDHNTGQQRCFVRMDVLFWIEVCHIEGCKDGRRLYMVRKSWLQDNSQLVAHHYNKLENKGLAERKQSRIFHLRNFNNWIKSVLIGEFLQRIKSEVGEDARINVLDIGAGKGGDLLKWQKGNIHHLVCSDIAATSMEQCESRYRDMRNRRNHGNPIYTLETITADCTRTRLKELYKNPSIQFDLTSCQFSFHYCFQSLDQARVMIRNAAECLRPGGFFIGTTPDAYDIMRRLKASEGLSFGNEVFSVTFENKEEFPVFGSKYHYKLDTVVDCPEFLVYFPAFQHLAELHGLKLVMKKRFEDFFAEQHAKSHENQVLLNRMQALETYPPHNHPEDAPVPEQYKHAEDKVRQVASEHPFWRKKLGTMSRQEWEALTLYIVFAFVKVDDSQPQS
ncbi:RNMT [Cordylochernes scorpioides]|uniref:mRNA cap guanine-N(7) methyltransferase n=1 Tax=Cordylochernes scorpioides TaxID=51811 RepID=A0ABY6KEN5_9ARAC|nr:RNMT [Cordylochernes scorpioides]